MTDQLLIGFYGLVEPCDHVLEPIPENSPLHDGFRKASESEYLL